MTTTRPTPEGAQQGTSRTTTALVLGGTGRTGRRAVTALLDRGVTVRVVVRDVNRLPPGAATHAHLEITEAALLTLTTAQWQRLLDGCDVVVSCLGHTLSIRGVLGPPRDLVEQAVRRVVSSAGTREGRPVHLIVMGSVSVNEPGTRSLVRGRVQRALLWLIRLLVPPARDNQRAADYLALEVGPDDPSVEWVVVRPDTLHDGDVGPYEVSGELTTSLFRPARSAMANVAHLMAELATRDETWAAWRGRMPVITDAADARE